MYTHLLLERERVFNSLTIIETTAIVLFLLHLHFVLRTNVLVPMVFLFCPSYRMQQRWIYTILEPRFVDKFWILWNRQQQLQTLGQKN